ncbi:MAG TPA: universal stress protein [Streptosporangiaceae bacterium]|nr:universal stress protein [Streptosporangiaceae bacterium]
MPAKPVVAATDGSDASLRAVEWAAREAVLRGAPLRIVSATAEPPRMTGGHDVSGYDTVGDILTQNRDRALSAGADRAAKMAPGLLIDADQLTGAPAEAVTASGSGALMLVVGSRGMGEFAAMVLGSVSRYAATHASCPVVVVRETAEAAHRQVGIGIADPQTSAPALEFAFEEAALRKAGLVAVHAWHMPDADVSRAGNEFTASGRDRIQAAATARLEELLGDWRAKYPDVTVSHEVVHGHAGRALAGLSGRADLVVLGRHHAHHGPASVLQAVLSHAYGPIATVPSA